MKELASVGLNLSRGIAHFATLGEGPDQDEHHDSGIADNGLNPLTVRMKEPHSKVPKLELNRVVNSFEPMQLESAVRVI
jgi:hypothetical protein